MKKVIWICCYLLIANPATAAFVNMEGESCHLAGGALIAGAIAGTIANDYWPESRGIIGFTCSTVTVLIGEGIQMTEGEEFSSSLQDIVAHTIGAIIGATITDRYFLNPVMESDSASNPKIGIVIHCRF